MTAVDTGAPTAAPSFKMGMVAKHSLIYAAGTLLGKSISFIMLPVYTRYLTPADYGVIALIEMTLDVICILAGAQLVMGVFRFYHKTEVQAERDAVVSTALLWVAAGHVLIALFVYLTADWLSLLVLGTAEHTGLVRLAAVSMAFAPLTIVPLSYVRLTDRSGLFVTATIAKLLISLTLSITFVVWMGMGARGVFLSTAISNAVVGITFTVWTLRQVQFAYSERATRDLFRFGVPLIAVNFATFFVTFGGRFFLQHSADETAVGLYSLGYQFGFLLAVAHSPFDLAWDQKRFEIAKRSDRDALLARGFVYKNLLMLPTAGAIALFIDDVLRIMTTPAFHPAATVVPVILVAYVFQGWDSLDVGILVRERTRVMWGIHWVSALVALGCFLILIPRYHAMGAALAAAITFPIRWTLIYYSSQRMWPVRYNWKPVIRLSALTITMVFTGYLLPELTITWSLAIRALLFAIYSMFVWRLGILEEVEKQRLIALLKSVRALWPKARRA